MNNQHGFMVTALAISILMIVVAMMAFSSVGRNVLALSTKQEQSMQAEYAAETGMRVSTLIINNRIISNLGYDVPTDLYDPAAPSLPHFSAGYTNADGSINNNVYYTVTVTTDSSVANTIVYTFTVVGYAESGVSKSLVGRYRVSTGSGKGPDVTQFQYIALSGATVNGDPHTLYIDSSGINFTNSGVLGTIGDAWNHMTLPSGVTLQKGVTVSSWPSIPIAWETSAGTGQTTLKNPWDSSYNINSSVKLNSGTYFIGGDLNLNNGGSITVASNDNVVIYVMGNANIAGQITGGNVTIYANSQINLNSAASLTGNFQLFSQGAINMNCPIKGYSLIMTQNGDINIHSGSYLVKSYLVSGDDISIDNTGVTITGSFAAKHAIYLHGGTITFDPNVISNWGK